MSQIAARMRAIRQLARIVSTQSASSSAGMICSKRMAHDVSHSKDPEEHLKYYDKKYYPEGYHPGHMDEAPVPSGSWQEYHNEMQIKYTKHLILGLVVFFGTIGYLVIGEPIDFVMPPPEIGKNPPYFSALPPEWRPPGSPFYGKP